MRRSIMQLCFVWALALLCALPGSAQTLPGPLKGHAILSGSEHCTDCHELANGKPEFKCLNCHRGIQEEQKSGRHIPLGDNIASSTCATCHTLHNSGGAASNDPGKQSKTRSPHGSIGIACRNCHTSTSFRPIRPFPDFKHSETRYPLRGMHSGLDCRQCHTRLVFANVGKQCADCHADFHRRQMGSNCEQCHSVRGWRISLAAMKNHANRFPLIGAHAAVDCESCHKSPATSQYRGLSTDCASCHQRDYKAAKSPDHQAARIPTICQSCHTAMDSWLGAKFDHNRYTGFLLLGRHSQLDCTACHESEKFAGTSPDCVSCHSKEYAATANPNHAAAGFSRSCAICHSATGWTGPKFDHSFSAKFNLTGAHTGVQCAMCHVNNVYARLSTDCVSCHLADYKSTANPNHTAAGFPQLCSTCHNATSWAGATFNHSTTPFPLTGAHTGVLCATCHKNSVYAGLSTACGSCHLTNYSSTKNPNHTNAGFPQDCSLCHSTASFLGATFNHSKTPFPLTGSHVGTSCTSCHKNNVYAGLSTACVSCHLTDYSSTTNPNHTLAGLPQQCSTCHNTSSWAGATFNHSTTPFPLTGAHTSVQCNQCHISGSYPSTPTDCYSCHSAEYKSTTNPGHPAAGFPTTCVTCHTTKQWTGATFSHTWWSRNHGSAKTCGDCHTNSSNYTVFTCTSCHTKAQADAIHTGRSGYVYNSANCYQCHRK
jgi:hypothetical protein